MPRNISIFDDGATIVPDFITPAEETRILQRIHEAPWLSDLSRRVQHYGYRYDYAGNSAPQPAAPFPAWVSHMAERLREHFAGELPVQCIVNEYRPGQGIGMHAAVPPLGCGLGGLDWTTVRPLIAARLHGLDCAITVLQPCPAAIPATLNEGR